MAPLGHLHLEEGHHLLHICHLQQPRLAALQDSHHHLHWQPVDTAGACWNYLDAAVTSVHAQYTLLSAPNGAKLLSMRS